MTHNKRIIALFISTILVFSVGLFTFIACNKKNNTKPFEVPNFTTVGEMLDSIENGTFSFNNVSLTIEEYEDGELTNKTTMKCGETFAFSQMETNVLGITSIVKAYTIPDLTDNCIYLAMNTFLSNGWTCSKEDMTLEGFDGTNLATIALVSNIKEHAIPTDTVVKVENNTITFETQTNKVKIYDFNATVVELEDEIKDYKSKC